MFPFSEFLQWNSVSNRHVQMVELFFSFQFTFFQREVFQRQDFCKMARISTKRPSKRWVICIDRQTCEPPQSYLVFLLWRMLWTCFSAQKQQENIHQLTADNRFSSYKSCLLISSQHAANCTEQQKPSRLEPPLRCNTSSTETSLKLHL